METTLDLKDNQKYYSSHKRLDSEKEFASWAYIWLMRLSQQWMKKMMNKISFVGKGILKFHHHHYHSAMKKDGCLQTDSHKR